jgi:hypothetical protein
MLRNIETFITENLQTSKNNLFQDILFLVYSLTCFVLIYSHLQGVLYDIYIQRIFQIIY